jgi:hypothetical protein
MATKETIIKIKEEIKKLAKEQKEDKNILRQPHVKGETWRVMCRAHQRSAEITILLNFYNEMRGREYRHSTEKIPFYLLNRQTEKAKQLIQEGEVVTTS